MRRRDALFKRLSLAAALLSCTCLITRPVLAQNVPPVLRESPLPHIQPQQAPNIGPGAPSFQPAPENEEALPNAQIPVKSVTVIGATAFTPAQLSRITNGLSGQTVMLPQLEAARRALVDLYRSHGYVLSTVSMDIDAQGNVQFIVTEGRIAEVKLSQNIGPAGTMVLAFLDHLTEERPVSEASLERWLLLAQQVPGVSVHAVLQADGSDPGALTLVAEVSIQHVSALATADNRAFNDTGPAEGLLVVDANSLTQFGDQTELSFFHTSGDTDNFGQASESFFLGSHGLRLKVYGGGGHAHPYGTLAPSNYASDVTVFGGQLSYPLILRRNQALNLYAKFDGMENVVDTAGMLTSHDSLRTARLATEYAWDDLLLGDDRNALNIFNAQFSKGLPILGASADNRTLYEGRTFERMDFWKINAAFERTQTLFSPFAGANVALHMLAGGQYTPLILPSEEEFNLGGSQFTRGFYSGEVVGDKTAYATAELQLNTGTDFMMFGQDIALGAQFYTFYDWGEAWSNLSTDQRNHRLASEGFGVRIGLTKNLEVDGEFVHRATTRLDPLAENVTPLSQDIAYWGVTARY